jgi:hypothetical protein
MTDDNRPRYDVADRAPLVRGLPLPTTGPIFGGLDFAAGIVVAVMILGPLAMAAFWVPYH